MDRQALETVRDRFARLREYGPVRMLLLLTAPGFPVPKIPALECAGAVEASLHHSEYSFGAGQFIALSLAGARPAVESFSRAATAALPVLSDTFRARLWQAPPGLNAVEAWSVAMSNAALNLRDTPGLVFPLDGSGLYHPCENGMLWGHGESPFTGKPLLPANVVGMPDVSEWSFELTDYLLRLGDKPPKGSSRNGPKRDDVASRIEAKFATAEGQEQLRDCTTETEVARLLGVDKRRLNENPAWIDPAIQRDGRKISRKHIWQIIRRSRPKTHRGQSAVYGTKKAAREGSRETMEHFREVDTHLDEAAPGFGD